MEKSASELWLPIPGYEGSYEVSDLGRIRSLDRTVPYKGGTPRRIKGRVLKPNLNNRGYPYVILCRAGSKDWCALLHKVVTAAFLGPPALGLEVLHERPNPADVRLVNLRYGTHAENMAMMVAQGNARGNQVCAARTHCPLKHLLQSPNLHQRSLPARRSCLACRRAVGVITGQKTRGVAVLYDKQALSDAYYAEIMYGDAAPLAALGRAPGAHVRQWSHRYHNIGPTL